MVQHAMRTEAEIMNSWVGGNNKPLVSIRCTTFNHASFIEEAIIGFLSQQTNFSFEIWIHDDASTDGTREIIERYQKSYPRIINSILQTENQYSKGEKPGKLLIEKCRGKYIAVCEGDDYWVDPKKLQIQVDFLENNPEYVISGHDAFIMDENGSKISDSKLPDIHKRDYSKSELSEGDAWILTMSWLHRNVVSDFALERKMVKNGDTFFVSLLGAYGKSHYHADIMPAAYRAHPGGVWSSASIQTKLEDQLNTYFWMYRYYKRVGNDQLSNVYYEKYIQKFLRSIRFKYILIEVMKRFFLYKWLKYFLINAFGIDSIARVKKWFLKA